MDILKKVTPDECGECSGVVTVETMAFNWPPIPVTADGAVNLFKHTNGTVVLEIEVDGQTEKSTLTDRLAVPLNQEPHQQNWYVGLVGENIISQAGKTHQRIWEDGEFNSDEFEALIKQYPTNPVSVWDSPLEGFAEDASRGMCIDIGTDINSIDMESHRSD